MIATQPDDKKNTLRDLNISETAPSQRDTLLFRSKVVRIMRLAFPILAIALLFAVFIFNDREIAQPTRTIEEVAPQQMGDNELINPQFRTQDSKDGEITNYLLEADRAFQKSNDEDSVILEMPKGDLALDGGDTFILKAKDGVFHQEANTLDLDGDVELQDSAGYTLKMPQVFIDIDNQTADTDLPTQLNGPDANIDASGFSADGKTSTYIFKGPAKLTLQPQNTEGDTQ